MRKHENSKKRQSIAKESQKYTREPKLEDQEELFIYLFILYLMLTIYNYYNKKIK